MTDTQVGCHGLVQMLLLLLLKFHVILNSSSNFEVYLKINSPALISLVATTHLPTFFFVMISYGKHSPFSILSFLEYLKQKTKTEFWSSEYPPFASPLTSQGYQQKLLIWHIQFTLNTTLFEFILILVFHLWSICFEPNSYCI